MKPDNIKNRIKSRLLILENIKYGSMSDNENTQADNLLNPTVAVKTGIRVKIKNSLEKVPILGPLFLWSWRLITLPSRFHRLSRHFEAGVQVIATLKGSLTKQDERIQMINLYLDVFRSNQEKKNHEIIQSIEQMRIGQDNTIQMVNQTIERLHTEQATATQQINQSLDNIQSRQEKKNHEIIQSIEQMRIGQDNIIQMVNQTIEHLRVEQESATQQIHQSIEHIRTAQDTSTQKVNQAIERLQADQTTATHQINQSLDNIQSRQGKDNQEKSQSIKNLRAKQESAIQQINQSFNSVKDQMLTLNKELSEMQGPVIAKDTFSVDIPPYISDKDRKTDDENKLHMTFENIFRGSEGEIKNRQRMYLKYIQDSFKKTKKGEYFLDAGCGRGEFLKLLREVGVPAKGVEINLSKYNYLKSKGFNVELADVNKFLKGIENNSLKGVSGFQFIEHHPSDYFKKFLDLAYRKTVMNSIIILETVNTKCSHAVNNFYLDPTHLKPYPPELLKFLLEWYGFKNIKIIYSSPCPEAFRIKDAQEHNYMDCAVLGWKR